MRILTVADFFYPQTVGGSAIVAYQIMRELTRRGHEIDILTRQEGGKISTCQAEDVQVHRYSFSRSQLLYPMNVLKAARSIRNLLVKNAYDLINAHHASSGLSAAMLSACRNLPPFVFFFHGPWHREAMANDGLMDEQDERVTRNGAWNPNYFLRKGADWYILRSCTAVVGLSDYMFQEAREIYPFIEQKFRKIPSGVDVKRFQPDDHPDRIRKKLGLPLEQVVLLTVRRLSPRMGLENLIRAMALVEKQRDDVMLVIGGKGELRGELERLIQELGVRRVWLAGFIDDEDLSKYYQACDLFIMPSVTLEGFGLTTLEALACGTPVLGTPTGGTPEILREVLPDFILSGIAPEDIAKGILQKIPRLRDAELKSRIRRFAEAYSWEKIADSVEDLFQALAGRT